MFTRNPYSIKISNAIAEATKNQIRTLIDICYGMPKFERMRKMILFILIGTKKTKDFEVLSLLILSYYSPKKC
ncbi:MAG: hypothetical protein MJ227_03050 [Bacilli bacterium]|nr:hypothetical protein [Bacilli bacterium]